MVHDRILVGFGVCVGFSLSRDGLSPVCCVCGFDLVCLLGFGICCLLVFLRIVIWCLTLESGRDVWVAARQNLGSFGFECVFLV